MGAALPLEASALALFSSSALIRASSAAYGSVTALPAALLDAATAFGFKNAAFISMALAKAQDSIEIPDIRFTASPIDFRTHADLHRSRENGARPLCGIAEPKIAD
jgi:hypothetical protein